MRGFFLEKKKKFPRPPQNRKKSYKTPLLPGLLTRSKGVGFSSRGALAGLVSFSDPDLLDGSLVQRVLASRSMDLTSQWRRSVAATSVSETWHRFVTSINVYAIRRGSFVWNARETIKFIDPSYPSNPFGERKYKRYDAFSRFMFVSSRFFFFLYLVLFLVLRKI